MPILVKGDDATGGTKGNTRHTSTGVNWSMQENCMGCFRLIAALLSSTLVDLYFREL